MSHRIKGLLHNFLGTFTSRNSDYGGYSIFGLMIESINQIKFDLLDLSQSKEENIAVSATIKLAAQRFREQMDKSGVDISRIREAHLEIRKLPGLQTVMVNYHSTPGYNVRFMASVTSFYGKVHAREQSIFVAPHNPEFERQSSRVNEST